MEELEEELTCPICCSLFEDPRVLLCSHSFCKKCLEGLVGGSRIPVFRTPLKCPTCRKETPHNGASSLQINYSLRGIVEKYSRIMVAPKASVCKQHSGQPLNMFCSTDLKLICGVCATTGEHRGHDFCSLDEAYKLEKAAHEELLHQVEGWQSADVVSCLETLQSEKKKALQSVTGDAIAVTDYFDKLFGSLECKKNEILSDLETLKLAVLQAYDPEIAKLSAAMEEHRRALGLAESARSVADPLCFLQRMQEFREKTEDLRETLATPRKDVRVVPLLRNFDVTKWDSLRLRDVDKIAVPHESGAPRPSRRPAWLFLFACLLVTSLLLLPHTRPACVSLHFQRSLGAVSSHLAHAPVYMQAVEDTWTRFTCAAGEFDAYLIKSFVNFFDNLFRD